MKETLTVRSSDGTPICVTKSGKGPALVLVHGIAGNVERWGVAEALSAHFTLFAIERRGRGRSGNGPSYALAREAEDIAAVLALAGARALLGHSFGGLLALEAANLAEVDKLLVYEPYAPRDAAPSPSPVTQSFEAMIGEPEALLERFVRQIVQMSDAAVSKLRADPSWASRVAAAPTIPREMAAVECHQLDVGGLVSRQTRVRFLLGEKSPAFLREATTRIHGMIAGSDVVELPGQAHVAMDTAPGLFVGEVRSFFEERAG